ncbi:hypothetical protein COBT_000248 [Conglomerata obtusa]
MTTDPRDTTQTTAQDTATDRHDLASADGATKDFSGEEKDDVLAWEKEIQMLFSSAI